jgi:very-short-patch-repair endonuclease
MNNNSPPEAKIALFRGLFRGRDDVYPRRFESQKTGRSGYQPACGNEWVKGLCDKGRVKCVECPNRRFLPVSDEVIRKHLSGQDDTGRDCVMGVYPMLLDETCFLLAVDFDKEHWREDIAVYRETCRRLDIPVVLERSRSENGGHVWLFFAEPVPAALARRLASHLLTETMEQRPDIGLDSHDRFIPNQDTLPHGGLGNLIALPLQKKARAQGNSLFLDDDLVPHADQWALLASVNRISPARAQEIVRNAEADDRIIGVRLAPEEEGHPARWSAQPSRRRKELPVADLPESMDLVLGDQLYIPKETLVPGLRNRLLRLAAVPKDEERLLLATGRYIGEGFDDARLDNLFLALPVSWRGTIAQYAGRLHRLYEHKHEVRIYDYADLNVPMLARMFERRCRGYEAVGYSVHLPASGVPGWPAEVDLPLDPLWKQDYAASLRRWIRDGVDQPLATLFAEAVRVQALGTEGTEHARSASEAFLYRRLESLPLTSGRFRLSRELPIPFDGMGKIEVDLLDIETRIAIEIDGPQHLDDPDAYRRDRRKDRLLQENGYLVLRFLAEDIGKRLDEVLDSIARALANRCRKNGG